MGYLPIFRRRNAAPHSLETQECVIAVKKAKMPSNLKKELYAFINRNILPDCGRVPPNCLKAHMIKTAQNIHLPNNEILRLKDLFEADIGYNGWYLDAGRLKRVENY